MQCKQYIHKYSFLLILLDIFTTLFCDIYFTHTTRLYTNAMRSLGVVIMGFMFMMILQQQMIHAQEFSPAPAPIGPVSDGSAVDQGVAYLLLLLALAVTYLVH